MSDPIGEMIAAFSTGCMDKENYIQFKDYLNAGGELPKGLMGELQNIVSMIPSILDYESPDPKIKDDVAKKLISLKDEIRTKIKEEKKKTIATFEKSRTSFTKSFSTKVTGLEEKAPTKTTTNSMDESRASKTIFFKTEPPEKQTTVEKKERTKEITKEKTKVDFKDSPPTLFPSKLTMAEKTAPVEQEKPSGFAGWLAIFLTLILFGVVGYFAYTSITDIQSQVADLKNELTRTKNDLRTTNDFMLKYMSVIEFLNYKDISILDMTSSQPNISSSAKIYLAMNQREALLQLNNVPPLKPDQTYQIWLVSKGRSYSLATFSPGPEDKFIKISNLPYIPLNQVDLFRITIEPAGGSQTPSGQTFLVGSLVSNGRR